LHELIADKADIFSKRVLQLNTFLSVQTFIIMGITHNGPSQQIMISLQTAIHSIRIIMLSLNILRVGLRYLAVAIVVALVSLALV